jgi:hypothetical protein
VSRAKRSPTRGVRMAERMRIDLIRTGTGIEAGLPEV